MIPMLTEDHKTQEPASGFHGRRGLDVLVNVVLECKLNTDIAKVETAASLEQETVLVLLNRSSLAAHLWEMYVEDTGLAGVHGLNAAHHVGLVPE
jgi:dUTPase